MKNVAVASSLLMLVGSAMAQPYKHHHHRRGVQVVYITDVVTTTVYYTSTCWVDAPTAPAVYASAGSSAQSQAQATSSAPAAPVLVQNPPQQQAPPPPAATTAYKATPADSNAAMQAAYISSQNAVNQAQASANAAQQSINAAQDRYNQQYQSSEGSGSPPPEKPKYTPPPASTPDTPAVVSGPVSSGGSGGGSGGGGSPLSGQTFKGDATYYDPGMGACGFESGPDELVCAISRKIFDAHTPNGNPNHNSLCNTYVRATANGKSVRLKVVDNCYGCKGDSDLDMTLKAFEMLGVEAQGRFSISWAPCT